MTHVIPEIRKITVMAKKAGKSSELERSRHIRKKLSDRKCFPLSFRDSFNWRLKRSCPQSTSYIKYLFEYLLEKWKGKLELF